MNNLLRAQFGRLWKNRVFHLCILAMAAWAVFTVIMDIRALNFNPAFTLDEHFFYNAPVIGLFTAIFISLFIGTEHSCGTMRNSIIVGHSRKSIYLALLTVCSCMALILNAVWFIVSWLLGTPLVGGLTGDPLHILCMIAVQLGMTLALTALFTAVAMLYPNRAGCAVVSILLYLGLLILSSFIFNALLEPEMTSGVIMTTDGISRTDPVPNPDYIGGAKRAMYLFWNDFLPGGQALQLADGGLAHPLASLLYDAFMFLVCTGVGLFLFHRKDLK